MELQPITAHLEPSRQIKKEHAVLLVLTLLFGILFDTLFYGKTMGVSYPVFVIAYYAILLWYVRKELRVKADFGWLLAIPVLMLSLTYMLHTNFVFYALNFMAIPVLVMAQTLLITRSNTAQWHEPGFIGDIMSGFFMRTFGNIGKPFSVLGKVLRPGGETRKHENLRKVLLGLLIALPLLIVILSLLSSADSVFQLYLGQIPHWFENIRVGEFLFRGFMILSVCILAFGFLWSLSERRIEKAAPAETVVKNDWRVWDPVVVITVLAAVDVIYVLFVLIQFSYLFGGLKAGLPAESTYAEYARRGFFELVTVTMINFGITLLSLGLTKKSKRTDLALGIMNTVLAGCTLVMLFSAHFRMSMYEEAYGYTYLRMFTHLFMGFLFILLLMALYRIWNDRFKLAKPYIITAIAAFLLVNYLNVDVIIARNNVDRYFNEKKLDIGYLYDLSFDAAPQVARLLDSGDPAVTREANDLLYRMKLRLPENSPWQSFNLSVARARQYLNQLDLTPIDDSSTRWEP